MSGLVCTRGEGRLIDCKTSGLKPEGKTVAIGMQLGSRLYSNSLR